MAGALNTEIVEYFAVPKWKKNATKFIVGVNYNETRGYQTSIPKPVAEVLGKPKAITYVLKGKKIELEAAEQAG
jgi:hypothetical protein